MMQTGAPHIPVDQQNLAALVASQVDRQVDRDEALAFLRQTAADQDRLQAGEDRETPGSATEGCGTARRLRRRAPVQAAARTMDSMACDVRCARNDGSRVAGSSTGAGDTDLRLMRNLRCHRRHGVSRRRCSCAPARQVSQRPARQTSAPPLLVVALRRCGSSAAPRFSIKGVHKFSRLHRTKWAVQPIARTAKEPSERTACPVPDPPPRERSALPESPGSAQRNQESANARRSS